ncbi:CpsD/CapB family tyrosine-protein kinase [Pseudomonadales bacterium]|nr:CpsD/CapB family tyrosine-protein kinase [Pseudomonadales bacterium]
MERIQEAIEKARRERQGNIGNESDLSSDSAQSDDPLRRGSSLANKSRPTSASKKQNEHDENSIRIEYSQTKTIALDEADLKERRIVAGFAHDSRSEPYRQLRSQILKKFRDNNWQTLAITSPKTGSGRTLTAVNLAISLSLEANQTVLLVDLDLRAPGVAGCLGIHEVDAGLMDYITGKSDLKDVLINPGYERLVVIPGTPQGAFTSEMLSSPEMKRAVSELVERYPSRLIVFDLPAVLDHDDALVFAPKCDATLMVLEEGGSKKADVERAYQLLEGTNIIGSVLNKVRYG